MHDPGISVVMCTYNGGRFVAEQLNSIREQTFRNLEIIVVDDASTDDTWQILEEIALADDRIRLYHNPENLGFNLNFNRACTLATGAYVAIADQDDVWHPTKLERMLEVMQQDSNTVMVHCMSGRFDKCKESYIRTHGLVNYFAGADVRTFFLFNFISGHNMLVSRKLLEASLPYPKEVYYDWWLSAVASTIGKIVPLPEVLVWHRVHDQNATGAAKPVLPFHTQVENILPHLLRIPGLTQEEKAFGEELLELYKELRDKKFSVRLFRFLYLHAGAVFAYKKRVVSGPSFFKNAIRFAKADTLA